MGPISDTVCQPVDYATLFNSSEFSSSDAYWWNEADFYYSNKTFVYDFLVNTWTSGPEMSVGRANHGCTSFTDKDDIINWTIVSGDDSVINKLTQMLKENSSEWTDMEMNYLCMQIGISPYTNNALSLIILWVKLCLLKAQSHTLVSTNV